LRLLGETTKANNPKVIEKIKGKKFYLFYNQDNSKKIVSVINSKTSKVIYNSLDRMSFTIKEKLIKELNKVVSKS